MGLRKKVLSVSLVIVGYFYFTFEVLFEFIMDYGRSTTVLVRVSIRPVISQDCISSVAIDNDVDACGRGWRAEDRREEREIPFFGFELLTGLFFGKFCGENPVSVVPRSS